VAGVCAGTINTVVGSGTLITFPVLLAVGLPPVTANVSNTVGLFPGSFTGAYGYRRELAGQGDRIRRLGIAAALGGLVGAVLLLTLPAAAFKAIVPVLIVLALILVVLGPRLSQWTAKAEHHGTRIGPWLTLAVFGTGIYGGYFGAAQGVILMGIFGLTMTESIQHQNGLKNVLAGLVNLVAAVVFICTAHVDWAAAGLIAAGAVLGGLLGARIGRRLSPGALRAVIVVVGVSALVKLLA
jgi:uncharacterized membrane protein YfcA